MFRSILTLFRTIWTGRWRGLALLVACLGLSGCTNLDLRGQGFPESELTNWVGQVRRSDTTGRSFAFSNKARQIDKNCGGPR